MVMMRNVIETFTQVKGQESTATRTFSPRGDMFIHNLQFRKDKRKVSD